MPKVIFSKPWSYFRHGDPASYRMTPEMGEVSHLPKRIYQAAIDDGAAKLVKQNSQTGKPKSKPLGKA